jgi:hypothetical protein
MSVRMRVQEHVVKVKGRAVKGHAVPYDPLLPCVAIGAIVAIVVASFRRNRNIFLNRQSKIEASWRGFAVGGGRERRKRFLIGDIQR